ncbi:MAG: rRNA pseudouridine synthase [Bifidobacteriaceae bacterium]|nr:rRNA pseudouridine synthase [Bifidobacteriaceae bacterium]
MPGGERLQKVLAEAGFGSRRACEQIIADGRVEVDGQPILEPGVRVDPTKEQIRVDGMPVQLDGTKITLVLHKPAGVVSTMDDPQGRPTVADYVQNRAQRLFHVGRLDIDSEGLLLLTNDGELAHRLTHPAHEVPKTYVATVEGKIAPGLGRELREGVELEDGVQSVDSFRVLDEQAGLSLVEVVLHSGANRVVRRLLEAVGHPVVRLVRTAEGPIRLGDLKPGRTRVLGRAELSALMADLGM